MKEDAHLNRMIENWKKKKSCVGVCYLVKVKMMKDKKFRREIETDVNVTAKTDKKKSVIESDEMEVTSTSRRPFSQLLWDSYLRKTQKKRLELESNEEQEKTLV